MSLAALTLVLTLSLHVIPAAADDTDVEADTDAFAASATAAAEGSVDEGVAAAGYVGGPVRVASACGAGTRNTCEEDTVCGVGMRLYEVWVTAPEREPEFVDQRCEAPADVQVQPPVVTPGMVLAAFRRIPLPESVLEVQPPEGETLVNFETNFYTEAAPFSRAVTLLGQVVRLRIEPESYT